MHDNQSDILTHNGCYQWSYIEITTNDKRYTYSCLNFVAKFGYPMN